MNPSTKDEIKGSVHEVQGKVKETVGKITNDPNLQAEGNAEKKAERVEKKAGRSKVYSRRRLVRAPPGPYSRIVTN